MRTRGKKLPGEFREQHPEVEWGPIARPRDRLTHGYFGIDYQIVWDIAQTKIPPLRRDIGRMIGLLG